MLDFIHEEAQAEQFQFLDVKLTKTLKGMFTTTVCIEPTDNDLYANVASHPHNNCKKLVVKSLVKRALKDCSTWDLCNKELTRIKQVLLNNDYPLKMVHKIIRKFMNCYHVVNQKESEEEINLHVQLYNISRLKNQSNFVGKIVDEHVKDSRPGTKVKLMSNFRARKLSTMFSTRVKESGSGQARCVYHFTCPIVSCQAKCIGHTTCKVKRPAQQHRYKSI